MSQEEKNTDRSAHIINQAAGTLSFVNTTGEQRVELGHRSGANLRFTNVNASILSPNTFQVLAKGKSFFTVENDSYETVHKNSEKRVYGNFNVITGSKLLFNDSVAKEYLDERAEIAALQVVPEKQIGGVLNNSGAELPESGVPNLSSGAVEGGEYSPNPAATNVQQLIKEKTQRLTELESRMGQGGHIILSSAKHLVLVAGTVAEKNDTGYVVEKGRSTIQKWTVTDPFDPEDDAKTSEFSGAGEQSKQESGSPFYESKNTSGSLPFGDIILKAGSKINIEGGSGGMSFNTAGEANFSASGRLALGGIEVCIGGGTNLKTKDGKSVNAGRVAIESDNDVLVKSGNKMTITSPNVNTVASSSFSIETPKAHFTGDVYVNNKLHVHGNAIYNKSVHIDGNLHVDGDITCTGDITAGFGNKPVSLLNHKHPGDGDGSKVDTGSPIR